MHCPFNYNDVYMCDDIDEMYNVIGTVIRIIHSYVQYLLITVLDEPMKQRVLRSYQQLCTNSELRNANGGIQTY